MTRVFGRECAFKGVIVCSERGGSARVSSSVSLMSVLISSAITLMGAVRVSIAEAAASCVRGSISAAIAMRGVINTAAIAKPISVQIFLLAAISGPLYAKTAAKGKA